jgi:hypothetical protein
MTIMPFFGLTLLALMTCSAHANNDEGKHLFILAGQSNMLQFNPKTTFIPLISAEYGQQNIVVVKDAYNAMPIRKWYRDWHSFKGEKSDKPANLYDNLLNKIQQQTEGEKIKTVTFIWMQGERDALEQHGKVYRVSLKGLIKQLEIDLGYNKINVILGRLSDHDLHNKRRKHWTMIRDIQVKLAESESNMAWVNTDDLNEGIDHKGQLLRNNIHYSVKGYNTLGIRYAKKAIELISHSEGSDSNAYIN